MSELSSLFLKVKITKEQLENFLKSSPQQPVLNNNWIEWWDSRNMYSKKALTQEDLYAYHDSDNQNIIKGWLEAEHAFAFSDYDPAAEEWKWGMIFFSENFEEMIPMLAFITSIENFITERKDNMAIVYPFFWGDSGVMIYINFKDGKTLFDSKIQTTADVNPEILDATTQYLTKKWDEFLENTEID